MRKISFFLCFLVTFIFLLLYLFHKILFYHEIESNIMANKRKLKKIINNVCTDLFSECMTSIIYNDKRKSEDINAILTSILFVHSNYIRRISHPEPGMTSKAYYKGLKDNFRIQVYELADSIANL